MKIQLIRATATQIYYTNKHRSGGSDLKKRDTVYLRRKIIKTKQPSNNLDVTKLGPFKIEKQLGPVTFKLQFPITIKTHLVFHISLLEPTDNQAKEQKPVEPNKKTQNLL